MPANLCFFAAKRPSEPLQQKAKKILHCKTATQDFKIQFFTDVKFLLERDESADLYE